MIAIDARLNAYRMGGIAQYTRKLIEHLVQIAPTQEFLVLEHRKAQKPLVTAPNLRRARLWTPPHHRLEQWTLPLEIGLRRPALLHSPDFIPPLHRTFPAVITVHDLAFKLFPEILDASAQRFYGQIDRAIASANAIIADSHATTNDMTRLLNVDPQRIEVIHLATDLQPLPIESNEARTLAGRSWQAGQFMVFVSTLEPRKNIPTLLKALKIALERKPAAGYHLALAGSRGWLDDEIWQTIRDLSLADAVTFIEKPSDDEVRWLLSACRLYVNPSRYEGFGLPALEAMACGAPCVVADTSSLPEVVGDGALLIPPDDVQAWADAIEQVWQDAELRQQLSRRGKQRASQFSWHTTAQQTFNVYQRVLKEQN